MNMEFDNIDILFVFTVCSSTNWNNSFYRGMICTHVDKRNIKFTGHGEIEPNVGHHTHPTSGRNTL